MTDIQSDDLARPSEKHEMQQELPVPPDIGQVAAPQAGRDLRSVRAAPKAPEIYGTFLIGESEFAIPVSAVQEVVNEPTEISPVPLSPSFMLGLFNLRGAIIPIVDLRILLEYPEVTEEKQGKIAIIKYDGLFIGLRFDNTGEVINDKNAAKVAFQSKGGGIKDVVIEGVLKFGSGERLVQILDPCELLNLKKIPHSEIGTETAEGRAKKGKRHNCITFQFGRTSCAIDLRYVKEVKELPAVDQSLLAHGHIIGTTNLRGVILPVIDFRGFMGDDAVFNLGLTTPRNRKMLIIETLEGPVGLMVFSIDSILPYYSDDLLPFARLALPRSEFIKGCLIDEENRIVMMLDHRKLMAEPDLVSAAKSCQEVYPPETENDEEAGPETGNTRLTFIQFTFERKFALNTAQVSEVINRPEELLEPPYSLSFVDGIINLRGELITLFNPRLLYGLPEGPKEGQKVLIFIHEDQKYGMLVDTVDEIITTTERNVAELEVKDRPSLARSVSEDISGCLHHTSSEGNIQSILILDAGAMVERCLRAAG